MSGESAGTAVENRQEIVRFDPAPVRGTIGGDRGLSAELDRSRITLFAPSRWVLDDGSRGGVVGQESRSPSDVGAECDDLSDPARLLALAESGLGARTDAWMERHAERVRAWLRVPVALVSLVRSDEQVFPGASGLSEPWASVRRTPLTHSFCRHVVLTGRPLVIDDARDDPRVATNLGISELGVIAYAGAP